MQKAKKVVLTTCLFAICATISAQGDTTMFFTQSQKINNTGMFILGSWALTNMATGAYGWKNGTGPNKYFHQMNFFWNTVNISIASFALVNNYLTDYSLLTDEQLINNHLKIQKLYLINAGLDILYIGAGYGLKRLSENKIKNKNLMKGYGNSIMLQGGFLLVFDAVMYAIQHSRIINFSGDLSFNLFFDSNIAGIGLCLNY